MIGALKSISDDPSTLEAVLENAKNNLDPIQKLKYASAATLLENHKKKLEEQKKKEAKERQAKLLDSDLHGALEAYKYLELKKKKLTKPRNRIKFHDFQ